MSDSLQNFQAGDTVRLKATFYNWDGALENPTNVIVDVLAKNGDKLFEQDVTNNRLSTGVFYCDYSLPMNSTYILYEFRAEMEGSTVRRRRELHYKYI